MELLPNELSHDERKHVAHLLNRIATYNNEHIPLDSRMPVMQGLVLNIQGSLLSSADYRLAIHIARYITRLRPHPDKIIRRIIDKVLSEDGEKLLTAFEKQFKSSTVN